MPTSTLKCRCGCKQRERRESMLITPNGAAFINADHAASYGKERAARLRKKPEPKRLPTKLEYRRNDYSHQFQLTKKAAQALANELDRDRPCICCDEPRGNAQFCGGHAKSAGAHPELALDLRNIHGQRNALCNQNKSGNWAGDKHSKGFRQGLIDRYGIGIIEYLESYHSPRRLTCADFIAMRKEFAAETRRLKQGLPPSRDWRALPATEVKTNQEESVCTRTKAA
jgi:hypothetical protein